MTDQAASDRINEFTRWLVASTQWTAADVVAAMVNVQKAFRTMDGINQEFSRLASTSRSVAGYRPTVILFDETSQWDRPGITDETARRIAAACNWTALASDRTRPMTLWDPKRFK